jgi:hypothetical protein
LENTSFIQLAFYNITPADKYPKFVIPVQAGIQQNTGCRIKSGMTELAI